MKFTEFNIRGKTDNGSNFIKAFRVYGELNENNNTETVEGSRSSHMGEIESDVDDEEEGENSESVEFVEAGTMLDLCWCFVP